MQFLNFHMFHIGLLPGVFQNILWAREESFKIYSGHFLTPSDTFLALSDIFLIPYDTFPKPSDTFNTI